MATRSRCIWRALTDTALKLLLVNMDVAMDNSLLALSDQADETPKKRAALKLLLIAPFNWRSTAGHLQNDQQGGSKTQTFRSWHVKCSYSAGKMEPRRTRRPISFTLQPKFGVGPKEHKFGEDDQEVTSYFEVRNFVDLV
jgi:hypothetical protein